MRLSPVVPALVLAFLAGPAAAADRTVRIGSFERLRVDGPFEVRVVTGRSPGASVSADPAIAERIDLRVNGTTLVVRMGSDGWGEQPRAAVDRVPVVTLTTPALVSATVFAGGRVSVDRMRGQRVDVSVSGSGEMRVADADAQQLNAQLIGTGAITLGGRAVRARLLTNGPGSIDAAALETSELTILLDGPGETRAQARYTAQVTNTGLGRVVVAGRPKCTIKAVAGGPVSCGPNL